MDFIEAIEHSLGKKAIKRFMPMQAGDVSETWADVKDLVKDMRYSPGVDVREGVQKFVQWYKEYFKIN
jgi:UDP-glucuronate 4-epimerase